MSGKVVVLDLVKPVLHNSKPIYMRFDVAGVSTNKKYFFERDQDLDENWITGIDAAYYSNTAWNAPQQITVGGVTYNTITQADLAKVVVSFTTVEKGKVKIKMRKCPLSFFRRDLTSERPRYTLAIDSGSSYLEFMETPLATALPMIIPFYFCWD